MAYKLYKGLPLFSVDIESPEEGVDIISLVDFPAVERNFIKFSKEIEEDKFKLQVNEEKRIVSGVALIPEQKIYRRNPDGTEYYMMFSREAIERIAQKFFGDKNSTNVNLQHEVMVDDCIYFESYFINRERNILPVEFNDLPDGTWIVSCKINNDEVWELVKSGELKGFSIEGNASFRPVEEEKEISTLEELLDYLINN